MGTPERKLVRWAVIVFAMWYLAFLALCAAYKIALPWLGARLSWSEVFYGPAITMVCYLLLFFGAVKLERWIRR
jgi:hypothetical protein